MALKPASVDLLDRSKSMICHLLEQRYFFKFFDGNFLGNFQVIFKKT